MHINIKLITLNAITFFTCFDREPIQSCYGKMYYSIYKFRGVSMGTGICTAFTPSDR